MKSIGQSERKRTRWTWTLVGACLLMVALGPLDPLGAQEPTSQDPESPEADGEVASPYPIAAVDVPARAEALNMALSDLARSSKKRDPAVVRIEERLGEFSERMVRDLADISVRDLETMHIQAIEDQATYWNRRKAQLSQWGDDLHARSTEFDGYLDILRLARDEWSLTADSAEENAYPAVIVTTISDALASIDTATEAVQARTDQMLALQTRVAIAKTQIIDALSRLENATVSAERNLVVPESPPFWRLTEVDTYGGPLWEQFEDTLTRRGGPVVDFLSESRSALLVHAGLFASLLTGLILLRRRLEVERSPDQDSRRVRQFLDRPISTAGLLSLLFLSWVYVNPPVGFVEIILLLAVVPVLRLLPNMLPAALRPALYGLTALYGVHKVARLALPGSLFERVALLVTTLLGILVLLWLWRSWRREENPLESPWPNSSLTAVRVMLALLGASLLANLFGMVALAEVLVRGTLYSAYLAAILFCADRALNGLLAQVGRTAFMRSIRFFAAHVEVIAQRRALLVHLFIAFLWLRGTLKLFRLWEPMASMMAGVFGRVWKIGTFKMSLGDLLLVGFTLWIAVLVSRFVRAVLEYEVYPRVSLPRGVPSTLSMLVNYGILTIGFFLAIAAAGIELSRFALLVGALGVGIGFGLQNLVNNFVSGLILIFERPIKVGDTIEVGSMLGDVRSIGIRASVVNTVEGAEVIVPNGNLISNDVVNWTLSNRQRRIDIPVGVAYGTSPRRVIEVLNGIAEAHPSVNSQPAHSALFMGFGESSLDFTLRAWTPDFEKWVSVRSELAVAICEALDEAGIEIPFPQRDLHLRSVDPSAARAVIGGDRRPDCDPVPGETAPETPDGSR